VNKTFLIGGSYITEIDNPSSTARIDGVHDVTFLLPHASKKWNI
jgi:hypothetical protein